MNYSLLFCILDEQCTTFYKVGEGSSKMSVICGTTSGNDKQPYCICGAGLQLVFAGTMSNWELKFS